MATTPTISDVARLAGVSVGTVSHVLRGKVRVSENLSQRVHEAAAELGYVVDPSAQALRLGYQNIVGVGLLGARKEVEQEALVLSPTHSPVKDLCLEDFTELVTRAKRSHLHSLLICLGTEFSSCPSINAEAYVAGTDKHRFFPIGQSVSGTRVLPIFEVHINAHGTQGPRGEKRSASLEWHPLRVGSDSAEGHSLTRGNIADCIAAIMDSRDTTRVVG